MGQVGEYGLPSLNNGLRNAESIQLSMDYVGNSEVFGQLELFCGKYVDERTVLAKQLEKHQELVEKVGKNQLGYHALSSQLITVENMNPGAEHVLGAARGAAGAYMLDLKHAAGDSLAKFLEAGDNFSVLLAEFCQERLEGQDLIIMGKRFDYKLGFIVYRPTNMVYGSQERFIELRRNLATKFSNHEMESVHYSHAGPQEWANLLNNLELITQF